MTYNLHCPVIAGMGIGFGNGGGMKGRNRDWKIKSNSFVIGEKNRCLPAEGGRGNLNLL
jgi:hypothetical protein